MPTSFSIRIAALAIAGGLALALLAAWRADRRDRAQLAADLAIAQQALAQADARQHDRDAQLRQTLAALAAEKRTFTTPAQIVRQLPQRIPLPSPITLQPAPQSEVKPAAGVAHVHPEPRRASTEEGLGSEQPGRLGEKLPVPTQAVIPTEDLKPLYDFALDCKACQAKLAAAQADLTDERTKTAVLTRERDAAVRAAKGGSLLRRIARNAKWLAIGAAAGAIAAKAHP
ncbi:MAG TPA: hypothetical protein VN943_18860 [Candidatus Acidoferrum sp.]|nr:hypothetical protein [Candidatus Acidoferrum sp.]